MPSLAAAVHSLLAIGLAAAVGPATAQPAAQPAAEPPGGAASGPAPPAARAPAASRATSAARAAPASPLVSQLRAQRVVVDADGKESLEDAANVTVGDTVVYSMQHRNVSRRRLMQVDFGIPIPPGMSYLEGSATPAGAKRMKLDAQRDQMVWRVERLEPGDTVSMSLRMRIDPDPSLTPMPAERPRPAFRRQAP